MTLTVTGGAGLSLLLKAKKVQSKLRNGKLVDIASETIAANVKGGPTFFNKLLPISKAISVMDSTSLYYPGHSPDDKLHLELAHAIQFANSSYFNTKEVSVDDLDANISCLTELHFQLKVSFTHQLTLTL